MFYLRLTLLILSSIGVLYYILSTLALVAHFRGVSGTQDFSVFKPSVSVLKPVCGLDSGASANFESFLHQDYPDYEVIFGMLDVGDSAAETVLRVAKDDPRASVYFGAGADGANNKVRILQNLLDHSRGEIIVSADADTRVRKNWLGEMVAPLADSSVGVVTCLYRGIEGGSVGDALEGLHMSCVFAPSVAASRYIGGLKFALGAASAVRKSALDEIGGFGELVDYLADDYQLGYRIASAGHKIVIAGYVIDIVLGKDSLRGVFARELRWARTINASRPLGNLGLVFTFGFVYALLFLLVSKFSLMGCMVFVATAIIRAITAWIGAGKMGDIEFPKRAFLLPVRDMFSFVVWVAGYFSRKVSWRGRILRLQKDGKMTDAS